MRDVDVGANVTQQEKPQNRSKVKERKSTNRKIRTGKRKYASQIWVHD